MWPVIIRSLILIIFVVIVTILAVDIYTTIINYHIIIYLTLLTLPITSLAKQGVSIPFLLFIQFFWAVFSVWLISYIPAYYIAAGFNLIYYTLIDIILY